MIQGYTIITGASSGIGRGIAQILSRQRRLILCGRDIGRLAEVQGQCDNSKDHLLWPCDFENIENLGEALGNFLLEHNICVENFIHSAGMVEVLPIRFVQLERAQRIMNVNFFSAFEIIKVLVSRKFNQKVIKNILLVSSIYSKYGAKGQSIYCASKGAIDSLMKSLAYELAPKVRVNSILPGAIKTKMSEETFQNKEYITQLEKEYLLGFGTEEDIANTIEFLLSDKAKWITGQQIVVDGGRTAH